MSVEDYLAEPVFAKREIAGNAPECTVQFSNGTDLAAVPSSVSAVTLYDLKHLDELARFKRIRYFGTSKVNGPLVQLLSKSKSIELVHISNCSKELPEFDTRAKYFSFYGCSKLNGLSPIRNLSFLKGISISSCTRFRIIDSIASCNKLREFVIRGSMSGVPTLHDIEALEEYSNLRYLFLAAKVESKSFLPITKLRRLNYLWISTKSRIDKKQLELILDSCPLLDLIDMGTKTFSLKDGFVKKPSKIREGRPD